MKTNLTLIITLLLITCNISCNAQHKKARKATARTTVTEKAATPITYENTDFNYSAKLPAGFEQQNNDREMEAERGGKLFLRNGCMLDFMAKKMDYTYITPEESIKQTFEVATYFEGEEGVEMISKELKSDSYIVLFHDEFGYRCNAEVQRGGNKISFYATYDDSQREAFMKEVPQVFESITTK